MKQFFIFIVTSFIICTQTFAQIKCGAERYEQYLPLLEGKKVAILANHTSLINNDTHTVDFMHEKGVNIEYILAPEHGFRGNADAGQNINNSVDQKTNIKIVSLYGSTKKPSAEVMNNIDVLIFDLQDVGVRYFTYISSMHYLMEAAADYGKQFIVFDRPNPNGCYVDGPTLDMKHSSFVGIYPIPVVHGMTLGELAQMSVGEKWIKSTKTLDLTVIECENYTRDMLYELPIKPSPNLPNMKSVYLYPSTCYFEATNVSLGRGTDFPFQIYGSPSMKGYDYSFTPKSVEGATNPPQKDKLCYGVSLTNLSNDEILSKGMTLEYIIDAYKNLNIGSKFFNSFFEKLIGVDYVRTMIINGASAEEIKSMWKQSNEDFKKQREKYLIYE